MGVLICLICKDLLERKDNQLYPIKNGATQVNV
jgi:hypothetical protein